MVNAFVFPGQGSQTVGMGAELARSFPSARRVFEEVDEALSDNLSKIIFEGPDDQLTMTRNTQPAIMAVSIAVVRALEETGVRLEDHVAFFAGHSLGEYSALAAAGSLSLADAARLLRLRGDAMQAAVPIGEGAMAAILGPGVDEVAQVVEQAAQGEVCEVANDNAPGQVVVSGSKSAVERAVDIAKARGAKRAMMLNVSAPFHCRLMAPAGEAVAQALAEITVAPPSRPIVANVTADEVSQPGDIRQRLIEQVVGTVRWRESVDWMARHGVERIVELGPGKVLTGLVRRIAPDIATANVSGPADVEAFKQSIVSTG